VAHIHHGFSIFSRSKIKSVKGEEKMKILLIGMMAATFVLGMGFLSFVFLFGRIMMEKV
jgi:hypothetical protein